MKYFKKVFLILFTCLLAISIPGLKEEKIKSFQAVENNETSLVVQTTYDIHQQNDFYYNIKFLNGQNVKSFHLQVRYDANLLNLDFVGFSYTEMLNAEYNDTNPGIVDLAVVANESTDCLNYDFATLKFSTSFDVKDSVTKIDLFVLEVLDHNLNALSVKGKSSKVTITNTNNPETSTYFDFYAYKVDSGNNEPSLICGNVDLGRNTKIGSGTLLISYDKDLLKYKKHIIGGYLTEKDLIDVNTSQEGFIYLSFIKDIITENFQTNLIYFEFDVVAKTTCEINLKATFKEACDENANKLPSQSIQDHIYFEPNEPDVDIKFTDIILETKQSDDGKTYEIIFGLNKNSHLGAGDFLLDFSTFDCLTFKDYKSLNKASEGQFFNVNAKNALNSKQIKISIISTKDIIDETRFFKFNFNVADIENNISNYIKVNAKSTTDSNGKPIYISNANKFLEVKANVITWSDWETIVAPTCTTDGKEERHATNTSLVETRTIPALGHDFGDYVIEKPGTYIKDGIKKRTCSRCGQVETLVIPRILNEEEINEIIAFATKFMNAQICGTNDYQVADSNTFMTFKALYQSLSLKVKEALRLEKGNQYSENIVEQMLARYDRIIAKYHKDKPNEFEDYLYRTTSPAFNENVPNDNHVLNKELQIFDALIISSISIGVIAFAIYLLIRKARKIVNK